LRTVSLGSYVMQLLGTGHRETIKYLYSLTDRELKDIGINRNEIVDLIFREDDLEKYNK
jgi:hypothetical protein